MEQEPRHGWNYFLWSVPVGCLFPSFGLSPIMLPLSTASHHLSMRSAPIQSLAITKQTIILSKRGPLSHFLVNVDRMA
jgi:hypothetical protein